MILQNPIWLILVVPFFVLFSLKLMDLPSRLLRTMRIVLIGVLILVLCEPAILFPSRKGTVIIVADRSASMAPDADARHEEIIQLVQQKMKPQDRLGLVSFGEYPVIEKIDMRGSFNGFTGNTNPDGSNFTEAVRTAMSLIPSDSPGRILVLTDGQWTGVKPAAAVSEAMSRQIPIDYRLIDRPGAIDLAITEIQAPSTVNPNESYMMTIWLQVPISQEIDYKLYRNGNIISQGSRRLTAGQSRLTFRDQAGEPGTIQYTFKVQAEGQDSVPENNTAKVLVGVEGQKPILCLSASMDSGFGDLLSRSGLNVVVKTPQQVPDYSLEHISGYEGLIIEDISANNIGETGMENIAQWVTKTGAGLMMTGGKNSYGPGGYFKSPLEPIMPVSMELRKEHRKLSMAIVVALDRSGSMGMPVGLGRTKMDLANIATAEALDLMSGMDQFGVLAVDSSAHLIVELSDVSEAKNYRNKILQMESTGGGIFIYEALSHAVKMILDAEPQTKHIILFADASDSEEPGDYRNLLAECTKVGITVSVVGLGKPTDCDAKLLEEIAALGQGQCFFTEKAEELPRLFAQDTFVVARSSFLEEATVVDSLPGMLTITGQQYDVTETVGGYNLCYLRDGATLAAVTTDEYQAPIMAAWQAGIGRTLCYTPQADGPYTGNIVNWPQSGEFFSSMAKWIAGQRGELGDDMMLTQQIDNGICRIKLHLNPDRDGQQVFKLPKVISLYGYPSETPESQTLVMSYADADTMSIEIPLQGAKTYLSTVEIPGLSPVTLPPVTLSYSPEFEPSDHNQAAEQLEAIADSTGGTERIDVSGVWNDLPRKKRLVSLTPWLLILAVITFLLEIFHRRTGLLANIRWNIAVPEKLKMNSRKTSRKSVSSERTGQAAVSPKTHDKQSQRSDSQQPQQSSEKQNDNDKQELFDAMTRAQQKAQSRTKRQ